MNNIDRSLYKALKFFSNVSRKECEEIKRKTPKKYVSQLMEDSLVRSRYINFEGSEKYSLITGDGLEQLRVLEDIKIKEKSIIVSIFALIISLAALAKSIGWM